MTPFSEALRVRIACVLQPDRPLPTFLPPNATLQAILRPSAPPRRALDVLWTHFANHLKLPDNVRSQATERDSPSTKH
jgi:hypothetical protein